MKRIEVDEQELKILYLEQGLGIPAIAQQLGIGKTTVHRRLHKYGIPVRGMAECKLPFDWKGICEICGKEQVNRSKCKSCSDRLSYQRHRRKRIEGCSRYRKNLDKDKAREYHRQYVLKNIDRIRKNKRKYSRENPRGILTHRLRTRFYCAMRDYSLTGKCKPSRKYGIDYQAIFDYLGPCPGDYEDYHIDHVFPLSAFDLNNPVDVRVAFAPENHQWLRVQDNLRKKNKYDAREFELFKVKTYGSINLKGED